MKSIKGVRSTKYILDHENNLMDDTGNYILDELGNQIKLTEQQILMIRDSNLVKYKEV
jgi:flagellar basal body rod protein FlgG